MRFSGICSSTAAVLRVPVIHLLMLETLVKELGQMGRSSQRMYLWLRRFVCSADGAEHFARVIATASAQSEGFFVDFGWLTLVITAIHARWFSRPSPSVHDWQGLRVSHPTGGAALRKGTHSAPAKVLNNLHSFSCKAEPLPKMTGACLFPR